MKKEILKLNQNVANIQTVIDDYCGFNSCPLIDIFSEVDWALINSSQSEKDTTEE